MLSAPLQTNSMLIHCLRLTTSHTSLKPKDVSTVNKHDATHKKYDSVKYMGLGTILMLLSYLIVKLCRRT